MHDYNVHEVFYINYEIHDQFKNYGHEILEQHPPTTTKKLSSLKSFVIE